EIEPQLRLPGATLPWRAFALRTPCALVHERATGKVFAVAEPGGLQLLQRLEADALAVAGQVDPAVEPIEVEAVRAGGPAAYLQRRGREEECGRPGNTYGPTLSGRWSATWARNPDFALLYNRLCNANPAPFAALAQWRGTTILSSSPERLVRINGRNIDTRPI